MPSSMWRPWSDSRQRTSVSVSSANQSIRSPGFQMPALLIQPPRLVEVPTSGLTVTTRSATSGASRVRSTKKRPNACWVLALPVCLRPRSGGSVGAGTAGVGSRRSRSPTVRHSSPAAPSSGWNGASGVLPQLGGQLAVLRVVEQRGVVGRVALGGQRPALDRVGEDDGRAVLDRVGLAVAVDQAREVVAAEVAEGGEQVRRRPGRPSAPRGGAAGRARRRAAAAGTPRWASRRCGRAGRGAGRGAGRT